MFDLKKECFITVSIEDVLSCCPVSANSSAMIFDNTIKIEKKFKPK